MGDTGENKDLSSGSSNVWAARNYSEEECLSLDTKDRQFYHAYANKNWTYTSNFDYSANCFR